MTNDKMINQDYMESCYRIFPLQSACLGGSADSKATEHHVARLSNRLHGILIIFPASKKLEWVLDLVAQAAWAHCACLILDASTVHDLAG